MTSEGLYSDRACPGCEDARGARHGSRYGQAARQRASAECVGVRRTSAFNSCQPDEMNPEATETANRCTNGNRDRRHRLRQSTHVALDRRTLHAAGGELARRPRRCTTRHTESRPRYVPANRCTNGSQGPTTPAFANRRTSRSTGERCIYRHTESRPRYVRPLADDAAPVRTDSADAVAVARWRAACEAGACSFSLLVPRAPKARCARS